jgi:hypothetical protein
LFLKQQPDLFQFTENGFCLLLRDFGSGNIQGRQHKKNSEGKQLGNPSRRLHNASDVLSKPEEQLMECQLPSWLLL